MKKRIVIDIDKELWRRVSIKVAEEQTTKQKFVEKALEEKLEKVVDTCGGRY